MMFKPVSQVLEEKNLWVATGEPPLDRFLKTLLGFWGYHLVSAPEAATLCLLCPNPVPPAGTGEAVRIELGGEEHPFPLDLEHLWGNLESRFHRRPRKHIRISCQLSARIQLGEELFQGMAVNMTDMGVRVRCSQKVTKGASLRIYLTIGTEVLRFEGRVMYVQPREEVRDWTSYDVGLLFEDASEHQRQVLREAILEKYLCWCRDALGEDDFFRALPRVALSARLEEKLKKARPHEGAGP